MPGMPATPPMPGTRAMPTSFELINFFIRNIKLYQTKQKKWTHFFGWRAFDSDCDQMFASQQNQTQHSFFFLFFLGALRTNLSELLAVAKNQIHVLVERLEGAYKLAAVLQCHSYAVVNVMQHFAALALGWLQ